MRLIKPQYHNMSDEDLMRSIGKGDKRAFDQIYDRYSGPLLGYFMRMLWKVRYGETYMLVGLIAWTLMADFGKVQKA